MDLSGLFEVLPILGAGFTGNPNTVQQTAGMYQLGQAQYEKQRQSQFANEIFGLAKSGVPIGEAEVFGLAQKYGVSPSQAFTFMEKFSAYQDYQEKKKAAIANAPYEQMKRQHEMMQWGRDATKWSNEDKQSAAKAEVMNLFRNLMGDGALSPEERQQFTSTAMTSEMADPGVFVSDLLGQHTLDAWQGKPAKDEGYKSNVGKLIQDYNSLIAEDPNNMQAKWIKQAIEKNITPTGMVLRQGPNGELELMTNAPVGARGGGKRMPAGEVGKIGEFKAYMDTMNKIESMIANPKVANTTGPLEKLNVLLDDWGVLPNEDRIKLRSLVARLPGLMYAMRGKQLSDKELEVALKMMPKMEQDDVAFRVSLAQFSSYMRLILEGKKAAYAGAGYDTGGFPDLDQKTGVYSQAAVNSLGNQIAARLRLESPQATEEQIQQAVLLELKAILGE